MTPAKVSIYLVSVLLVASIFYFMTANQQSYWIIWSAFIFSLVSLGNSFHRQFGILSCVIAVAAITAFIAGFCAHSIVALTIFLLFLTGSAVYFVEAYPEFSLLAFIVPLFGILGGNHTGILSANYTKLFFILLGGAIALASQFIFIYKFKVNQLHRALTNALDHLKSLSNEIFSCFQPAYAENIYLFERRIHVQKIKFLRSLQKVRELGVDDTHSLDNLFDILLDCSQLRNRITDHTVLSLCAQEMTGIIQEINQLFNALKATINLQKKEFNTEVLTQKIINFDEVNHNVLQVTAREPLVFVLFVASIKKLAEEMRLFYEGLVVPE